MMSLVGISPNRAPGIPRNFLWFCSIISKIIAMLVQQLPRWLCRNLKRTRAIALLLFCAIVIFIEIQISSPSVTINVDWTEFSLHLPYVQPSISDHGARNIYLAVVVNSAASGQKYRILRNAIRTTWANSSTLDYRNKTSKVFFVLGISENETEHVMNLREALQNNDIIIGNFTENYKSVILKTFMSHYWVSLKFPSCKYVLKTDDDVYIRVPKLLEWLERAGSPRSFYGGYVGRAQRTVRDPNSKWFLSTEQYEEKYWPPFCHGAFHVLSIDILPQYFNYTKFRRKPFHTDDAYLGVVARDLGVEAKDIPGFNLQFKVKRRSECELMSSIAMGHKMNASTMKDCYKFYTKTMKTENYSCLASQVKHVSLVVFIFCVVVGTII